MQPRQIAPMTAPTRSALPPTPTKKAQTPNRKRRRSKFNRRLGGNKYELTPTPVKRRKLTPGSKKSARSCSSSGGNSDSGGRKRCPKFFRNLGTVGTGSFANVFKVENAQNKKIYALKESKEILHTEHQFEEALNEVNIMKLLQKETAISHILDIL